MAECFSRPTTAVRGLADASYAIYLSHELVVVAVATLLLGADWPADVKFTVVVGATFAISAGFAWLVQRVRVLQWLYLGRSLARTPVVISDAAIELGRAETKDIALAKDATSTLAGSKPTQPTCAIVRPIRRTRSVGQGKVDDQEKRKQ